MTKFNYSKLTERILTKQSNSLSMMKYNLNFRNSNHGFGLYRGMLLNKRYENSHLFSTNTKCNNQFSNLNKNTNIHKRY